MGTMQPETEFFHHIAEAVIRFVRDAGQDVTIAQDKGAGDYSTKTDVDVENLIVAELSERFPDDRILAEEGYSDTGISGSRVWLIDPICGTANLAKGINNYCTNIALAAGGELVAACVIDHSRAEYLWSVGGGQVHINDRPVQPPAEALGLKIDIDFGAVRNADKDTRLKHNRFLLKLMEDTDYDVVSLNTSLGFAYTAAGRTDGFVTVFNHPWDICAASFLVRQAGGVLTAPDGSPWTITTTGAIGGRTPEIQKDLLDLYINA